jgi:hypothetical protein
MLALKKLQTIKLEVYQNVIPVIQNSKHISDKVHELLTGRNRKDTTIGPAIFSYSSVTKN